MPITSEAQVAERPGKQRSLFPFPPHDDPGHTQDKEDVVEEDEILALENIVPAPNGAAWVSLTMQVIQ